MIFQRGRAKVQSELRQLHWTCHVLVWECCLSRNSWLAKAVWLLLIHDWDWKGKGRWPNRDQQKQGGKIERNANTSADCSRLKTEADNGRWLWLGDQGPWRDPSCLPLRLVLVGLRYECLKDFVWTLVWTHLINRMGCWNTLTKNTSFKGIYIHNSEVGCQQSFENLNHAVFRNKTMHPILCINRTHFVLYYENQKEPVKCDWNQWILIYILQQILVPTLSSSMTNELAPICRIRIRLSSLVQLVLLTKKDTGRQERSPSSMDVEEWCSQVSDTADGSPSSSNLTMLWEKNEKAANIKIQPMWLQIVRDNICIAFRCPFL